MRPQARFTAGPGGSLLLPTSVDWARWPESLAGLDGCVGAWPHEYATTVRVSPEPTYFARPADVPPLVDQVIGWPVEGEEFDPAALDPELWPEELPHEPACPF